MGFSLVLIGALVVVGQCAGTCRSRASDWSFQARDATPVNGSAGGMGDGLGTVHEQSLGGGMQFPSVEERGFSSVRPGLTMGDNLDDARAVDAARGRGCGIVRGMLGRLWDRPLLPRADLGQSTRRGFLGRLWTVLRDRPRPGAIAAGRSGRLFLGYGTVRGRLGQGFGRETRSGPADNCGLSPLPRSERWILLTWTRSRFYSRGHLAPRR